MRAESARDPSQELAQIPRISTNYNRAVRARFGDLTFDSDRRELTRNGRAIALNPKAFELLSLLVESWPSAMSKETLYERLWPGVFVEMGNLHNLVSDIRLAVNDEDRTIIRTIHRFGYALGPDLERDTAASIHLVIGLRELPLHHGEHIIGRDLVGAPDVSRRHARLVVDGQHVTIEDLGSKNGTWIGGKRLTSPAALDSDQEVILGRTHAVIRFSAAAGETVTATSPLENRK